jgi:mannosyltransferase OCH1-like enzyme
LVSYWWNCYFARTNANYKKMTMNYLGYEDFIKEIESNKPDTNEIPKYIYRSSNMEVKDFHPFFHEVFNRIIKHNKEYKFFYFNDSDQEKFILRYYGKKHLKYYNTLIPTAFKSDFFRYMLLYKVGGCWGDFMQEPLVPYDEIIDGCDEVFVKDASKYPDCFWNAIMICKPENKVMEKAMEICIKNIKEKYKGKNPLHVTGPAVLNSAYRIVNGITMSEKLKLGTVGNTKLLHLPYESVRAVYDPTYDKCVFISKHNIVHDYLYKKKGNTHYHDLWTKNLIYKN